MNVLLVKPIIQVILSLEADEQLASAGKILKNILYPSIQELVQLLQNGGSFDLLNEQPDMYSLEDSEAIV